MTSQYSCVILRCWNLAKLIMHAYLPIATPGEKLHILEPGKAYPAKRCWQDEAGSTSGQTPAIHGLCSHNKVCTASWILFYPSWIKAFFKNFMSAFPTPLRENKMEAGSGSWLWNLEKGDRPTVLGGSSLWGESGERAVNAPTQKTLFWRKVH